jgi:hypothetical protein
VFFGEVIGEIYKKAGIKKGDSLKTAHNLKQELK